MKEDSGQTWQSISDMMSALMMIFLFISVLYMLQTQIEKAKMTKIAETYNMTEEKLHENLEIEFEEDLKEWRASLEEDNTIRFYAPEVLFKPGSYEISNKFMEILDDFFPRYVDILTAGDFKNNIYEIRIEGHTSSEWGGSSSFETRYLENLSLSQERSFEVLKYCFSITQKNDEKSWLTEVLRANGLSFAKPVLTEEGKEDKIKSRRVEFKAVVKSRERIQEILKVSK